MRADVFTGMRQKISQCLTELIDLLFWINDGFVCLSAVELLVCVCDSSVIGLD